MWAAGVGDITPGSVYAHIDQSLGPWAQRPVFKTNVKTFVSLRKTEPPIALADPGTRLDVQTDDGTRQGTTATLPFIDPNKKVPAA